MGQLIPDFKGKFTFKAETTAEAARIESAIRTVLEQARAEGRISDVRFEIRGDLDLTVAQLTQVEANIAAPRSSK
jgi:hypothetical protein